MIQNSEYVTPPTKFEPKVKSERKNGGILRVDKLPSDNKMNPKNNETEANCTFGIINNNSMNSRELANDSLQRKTSLKSSQESTVNKGGRFLNYKYIYPF